MALPKEEPMLTVKQAAEILGVDPRTIREKLSTKQIRGEKRLHGLKEKWFVVKADIEAIAREQIGRSAELHQQRIDTNDIDPLFEGDDADDAIEVNEVESNANQSEFGKQQLEFVIGTITQKFTEELSSRMEIMQSLQKELAEKDAQLKLLPDLEKAARERETEAQKAREALQNKEYENNALKRQLELLEIEQKNKLREYAESKAALEELESQEKNLKDKILSISEEKEVQEKNAQDREEELNRLKFELESKKEEIEKLQAPWWKKWFLPREIEAD